MKTNKIMNAVYTVGMTLLVLAWLAMLPAMFWQQGWLPGVMMLTIELLGIPYLMKFVKWFDQKAKDSDVCEELSE